MRLVDATLLALAALVPLAACSASGEGSGDRAGVPAKGAGGERHFAASGFDKVALQASDDVEVRTGEAFGVTATGAPADLDRLKLTREGETLGLGRKPGTWHSTGPLRWTVTMPRITQASVEGSGSMRIDRVDGGDFRGTIGGSGDLSVARMRVISAGFSIDGAGSVTATGTAQRVAASLNGSGDLRLKGVVAQTGTIMLAGAGNIDATVRGRTDVQSTGSGDVTVGGGAQCSIRKTGSGDVRCG